MVLVVVVAVAVVVVAVSPDTTQRANKAGERRSSPERSPGEGRGGPESHDTTRRANKAR